MIWKCGRGRERDGKGRFAPRKPKKRRLGLPELRLPRIFRRARGEAVVNGQPEPGNGSAGNGGAKGKGRIMSRLLWPQPHDFPVELEKVRGVIWYSQGEPL